MAHDHGPHDPGTGGPTREDKLDSPTPRRMAGEPGAAAWGSPTGWIDSWMGVWNSALGATLPRAEPPRLNPDRPGSLGWGDPFASLMAERRAAELIGFAQRRSPFYRQHLAGFVPGRTPWSALPTVDKRALMANFDDWHTDRAVTLERVRAFAADPANLGKDLDDRWAVWSSSGTSGEPALYLHDSSALGIYANLLESRMDRRFATGRWWAQASTGLLGPWGMRPRTALIAALDGPYASISFWLRQCRLHPWMADAAQTLSVTWPAERLRHELKAWQPAFVASYPSLLTELARWQRAGQLEIAPLALWSGGERLALSTRHWIEASFNAPVVNDYGASECLSIAFECRHGRLHLNDDWVILEPIDRHGAPVLPGEASHSVLLTNLANRIQPLIRYDLGDSVTFFPDRCPCGNPRPSFTVEGRHDDTLHVADGVGGVVHLAPMALTTAVEDGADVHRFQLRQTVEDAVELRADLSHSRDPASTRDAAVQALRNYLGGQGLPNARVVWVDEPPIVERRSGKLRQVVCLVQPPADGFEAA